jgi:RNA polymerase sigma-70 factor (ECF subfamily)
VPTPHSHEGGRPLIGDVGVGAAAARGNRIGLGVQQTRVMTVTFRDAPPSAMPLTKRSLAEPRPSVIRLCARGVPRTVTTRGHCASQPSLPPKRRPFLAGVAVTSYRRAVTEDASLLAAWREGDRGAGRILVDRHFPTIHRFFHNKVSVGVEDLVQQTFLACTESRHGFRGEGNFRAWLFGIANNVLRMHLRSKHGDPDLSTQSVYDLAPSPSAVVAARSEQRLLLEALRRIPLDYQVALELHFWEELSGSEIAETLGIPEGTVRTRLRRGRLALAEQVRRLAESGSEATSTLDGLDDWVRLIREQLARAGGHG